MKMNSEMVNEMVNDIEDRIDTPEYHKAKKTKEFLEEFLKNPEIPEGTDLNSYITQKLAGISSKYDEIEIYYSMEQRLEMPFMPVKTYKLPEKSTFEVLDDPETMILRDGLITIGGKTGSGKTSFATHLALEIMRANESTCFIFFSLDDDEDFCYDRMLSQITEGKVFNRKGSHMTEVDIKARAKEVSPHIFVRVGRQTPAQIKRTMNAINEDGKYKNVIVCIDYIQNLKNEESQKSGGDRRFQLNDALQDLKQVQKDTKSMVMMLAQLKRGEDWDDFGYRDTSEIENVSDVCIDIIKNVGNIEEDIRSEMDECTTRKQKDRLKKLLGSGKGGVKRDSERLIKISKNKRGFTGQVYTTDINRCLLFSKLLEKDDETSENKGSEDSEKSQKEAMNRLLRDSR